MAEPLAPTPEPSQRPGEETPPPAGGLAPRPWRGHQEEATPIPARPHRFQRATRSDDEETGSENVKAEAVATAPTAAGENSAPESAVARPVRLRPRERSAEEIAAAAAAAAAAPPRSFQEPPPEVVLSQAAAPWLRWLGVFLLVALALGLGYFVGRQRGGPAPVVVVAAPSPAPATSLATRSQERRPAMPSGPSSILLQPAPGESSPTAARSSPAAKAQITTWGDPEYIALDDALKAERTGDRAKATKLTTDLRASLSKTLPQQIVMLDIYLAELAIRDRRGRDAQALLFPLTRTSTPSAQACDRLGFVQARSRNFDESTMSFAQAAQVEPLAGAYFYRWGESLRRQGKLEEAVTRLGEALLRQRGSDPLSSPIATGLKLRLARIELGQTEAVRAETQEQMRGYNADQPLPPDAGDWMLTAAACDLQENKLASAADWLRKARAALPAGRYEEYLADYFFRAFAVKKELASVLPTPAEMETRRLALAARPDVYFVDP